MANRYVYHGGSNTSPYDTWAKAATTIATAVTGSAAGDDFFMASDHSESTAAAVTITFPATAAAPNRLLSVNRAGSVPPVAADLLVGGAMVTTGASAVTIAGIVYIYGLSVTAGSGNSAANIQFGNAAGQKIVMEKCALAFGSTSTNSRLVGANNAAATVELIDTTVSFGNASQGLNLNAGTFIWRNKPGSTAILGTTPNTLVPSTNTSITKGLLSGLDLSALNAGKKIFASHSGDISLVNCKLNASVTIADSPVQPNASGIKVIGSGSASNVRNDMIVNHQGTLTTETTIKRTAGASDGTTAFSHKIVTSANAKRSFPFETFEGALWNSDTGTSKTLTIHTVTDNVTLTDAEIWLEVEYLGSSATPVTTLVTDANATVLTTAANQTSDSAEAWTTTGLTTPVKQKLAVAFTPQMVGPIRWKVKVAKASTTVYICPKADLA